MDDALARLAAQLVAGDAFHRRRAPVSAHVGENLRRVGEQVPKEHGGAVERIVFGGENKRLTDAVPVEGRVQDCFHEVAVGGMVGPLALSLKARRDGVAAQSFFTVAQFRQARIAHHQVARDDRHLHRRCPIRVLLLAGTLEGGGFQSFPSGQWALTQAMAQSNSAGS